MAANTRFIEKKPLSRSELLAAMIIFLLPLLIPLISILASTGNSIPKWVDYFLLILYWGAGLFVLGLALIKRMPRWSLSYLGFILMLGLIFSQYDRIWSWIYSAFIQSFGPRSLWPLSVRIVYGGGFAFIMLFTFLVGALILVNLLRFLPFTRAVWQHIRADWTQLSFMLYGGLVFGILLAFEEYQHEEIWMFIAWTCLALGAWLYLQAKRQKQRILALIGGATAAMWIVATAFWVLIPLQDWQSRYSLISMEDLRWTDTSSAIINWAFILLMLIAPASLNLLPQATSPIIPNEEDPTTALAS